MPPTLGNGKICYLELPAADVDASAAFYARVFGWEMRRRGDGSLAFDDGVGEVSGNFILGRPPAAEVTMLVYIMVDDIEAAVESVTAYGGTIVQAIGADPGELTARFRDRRGTFWASSRSRSRSARSEAKARV